MLLVEMWNSKKALSRVAGQLAGEIRVITAPTQGKEEDLTNSMLATKYFLNWFGEPSFKQKNNRGHWKQLILAPPREGWAVILPWQFIIIISTYFMLTSVGKYLPVKIFSVTENKIPWYLEKNSHRHWKMCHPMLGTGNFLSHRGMENHKIWSFSSTMKTEHLYYFKSLEIMIIRPAFASFRPSSKDGASVIFWQHKKKLLQWIF